MADPGWTWSPTCPHQGGTSPQRLVGSAVDSCPRAPSPVPQVPQLRPLPAPLAAVAAGSTSGSPHPGPQHCPGACQSHCSPPAHRAGLHGKRECNRHDAVTWGGTAPSTGTWQDSPPSPAQACLHDREEGAHHHTRCQGGWMGGEWEWEGNVSWGEKAHKHETQLNERRKNKQRHRLVSEWPPESECPHRGRNKKRWQTDRKGRMRVGMKRIQILESKTANRVG